MKFRNLSNWQNQAGLMHQLPSFKALIFHFKIFRSQEHKRSSVMNTYTQFHLDLPDVNIFPYLLLCFYNLHFAKLFESKSLTLSLKVAIHL